MSCLTASQMRLRWPVSKPVWEALRLHQRQTRRQRVWLRGSLHQQRLRQQRQQQPPHPRNQAWPISSGVKLAWLAALLSRGCQRPRTLWVISQAG